MKTFLVVPWSWSKNCRGGVKYEEAKDVTEGIGYFFKDSGASGHQFHCKSVNDFYEIGNIRVEKCSYCPKGNGID